MCFGHLKPIYAYICIKKAINARRRRDFCSFTVIFFKRVEIPLPVLKSGGGAKKPAKTLPPRGTSPRVETPPPPGGLTATYGRGFFFGGDGPDFQLIWPPPPGGGGENFIFWGGVALREVFSQKRVRSSSPRVVIPPPRGGLTPS